ncbi:hypothetical protein Pmani_004724 [Petrolisthes manimaculis]|uniref:Uncharacterized protein n=1 Tax=Petrolisthes manimaculis TaxID=1843537 RepID=A0AAE1PE92_9EUCA|nr:hypothetical protein Pmani_022480 [Petrolisthes manimaculis]KAK4306915.1 hypothetical protein Pmani_021269 [Petrolisthes manimaculis]KAK4324642.1 hypothetical protein Pmani_004724 [Petrolisthes manimaculis]
MDLEAIKVLLDSQERTFRTATDLIVDQFKSRIQEAEVTIQDLTRSLEFSQAEVKDLQREVKELRKFESEIRRSGSEGVSTREADGDVTGAVRKSARVGESSVGAEGESRDVLTREAVDDVTDGSSVDVGGGGSRRGRPTPGSLAPAVRGNRQQQTSRTRSGRI